MYLNKVFVLGRVTRDPRISSTQGGSGVASFSIATNRKYKTKAGEQQEETEFHNIVFFGKIVDVIDKYVKKGSQVLVEGRITTRSWTDKKTGEERHTKEIVGERLQLGARPTETPGPKKPFD